jgi:hypothetical protein
MAAVPDELVAATRQSGMADVPLSSRDRAARGRIGCTLSERHGRVPWVSWIHIPHEDILIS